MSLNYEQYYTTTLSKSNRLPDDAILQSYRVNYLPWLPADRTARILDFGCGMGHTLFFLLAEGYRNCEGIDVSADCIDFCRRYVTPNVKLVSNSLEYLSTIQQSFDVIICKEVIEHINRLELVDHLIAIRAALSAGGMAIFETENCIVPSGLYVYAKDFTHQSMFTEESLRQVLEMAGFSRVHVFGKRLGVSRLRGWLWRMARWACLWPYRTMLMLDRAGAVPRIWSRNLIAIAYK